MTTKPKIAQSEDTSPKSPATEALQVIEDRVDKPIASPVLSSEKDLMQEGTLII
jgi:hypothetical protein